MPVVTFKPFEKYPEVKGLFVGGCVDRGDGSRFRRHAHAHVSKHLPNPGWICVLGWGRVKDALEKQELNQLLMHELAHILTKQGHTDKWRIVYQQLGGRIPKRYQKKMPKAYADFARRAL